MTLELSVLVGAFLVFGRLGGLFLTLPVISALGVPRHVGVLGAMALTVVVSPAAPLPEVPATLGRLAFAMGGEILLGVLMGSVVSTIFGAFALASEAMDRQMGGGVAMAMDPLLKAQHGVLGAVGSWLAGLVFLSANLHLRCIEALCESFQVVPPGTVGAPWEAGVVLIDVVTATIVLGLRLAGPVLALVWLVNVFVAVLIKLAPNMNVFFSIGMILTNVAGLMLFALGLPVLLSVHEGAMQDAVAWMGQILKAAV